MKAQKLLNFPEKLVKNVACEIAEGDFLETMSNQEIILLTQALQVIRKTAPYFIKYTICTN